MKKKQWNAGFSMVELLLAVAIVATLCGVGFVSVIQQRKNLAIMEANETAKEIFLAAQEHLSMAAMQGRLQSKDEDNGLWGLKIKGMGDSLGVKVTDNDGKDVSYAIFDEKSGPVNNGPAAQTLSYSASDVMLPKGSVDEFVLNHRYAVRYNAATYQTLEAFYTQNNYSFGRDGDGASWTNLETWDEGRQKVQDNPGDFKVGSDRTAVVMGWYGETDLVLDKPSNPQGIKPGFSLVNGPILYAMVALDTNYHYSDVNLKIEGVNADGEPASVTIPLLGITSERVRPLPEEDGVSYYMVILDDVTADGFGFNDMFNGADLGISYSSKIVPGSDIKVTAEAQGQEVTKDENGLTTVNPAILSAASETRECNSLFANGFAPDDAHITNLRHLQNLSSDNLDNRDKPVKAQLDQSVYWNSFANEILDAHEKYYPNDTKTALYTPVSADYQLTFEGNNHIIGNLVIDNVDTKSGNAGVFGTLDGGAEIKNLVLENTTFKFADGVTPGMAGTLIGSGGGELKTLTVDNVVSHTSAAVTATQYAGGLIGYAEGTVTVKNSASYSNSFAKGGENGAAASVTATGVADGPDGVAGGLIGAIKGADGSTVQNCAAANKVTANGAESVAGGLIGQASGTVGVSLSYAGGITDDNGKYEHEKQPDGKEKLIGNVTGAYAGGLIGQAANDSAVTLKNAYSAASVSGAKAANSVAPDSVRTEGVVYGAGESQTGGAPFQTGKYEKKPETGSVETGGKTYDAKLSSAYPYESLQDMGASGAQEWLINHVGDWPIIEPIQPEIDLHNEEILYVDVFLDPIDYSSAYLEIRSRTDPDVSVKIPFPFNPETGVFRPDCVVNPATGELESALVFDPDAGEWIRDPDKPQRVFPRIGPDGEPVTNGDGKICYRVILDDVTAEGLGFGDIKSDDPANPKNPIPLGSQIEVQAHATSLDGREGDSNKEECNSLFADGSSPTDAHIENFRHLQNLNNLDPGPHIDVTLEKDICWEPSDPDNPDPREDSFTEGLKRIREDSIPSPGDPVYEPVRLNDTTFDGGNHVIKNLEITEPDDDGNAGVFGTLSGDNTIEKLKLDNVSVNTPDADEAGALIGHSEGELTVKYVESHSNKPIEATDYAGGLIGYAKGDVSIIASASYSEDGADSSGNGSPGSVTATGENGVAGGLIGRLEDTSGNSKVEGCAAANVVTAEGGNGVAGGLIGQAGGDVDVKFSYAGGVTTGENPASVTGAYAGGLIGHSDGPEVTIEKSYSSATADGSKDTGSLSTGDAAVSDSYGANALPSPQDSDKPTPGKPYNQDLLDEESPEKVEYPYRSLQNIISDEDNLPEWFENGIPEWVSNHVGDWPPSMGNSLSAVIWGVGMDTVSVNGEEFYTVANDDVRYAWIDLSGCDLGSQPYITLSVSNLVSGNRENPDTTTLYTFEIRNEEVVNNASGNPNAEYTTIGPDGTAGGAGQWLRVTLDDITTEGQRFRDLFPALNPGQEIRIHAKASEEENALTKNDLLNDGQAPCAGTEPTRTRKSRISLPRSMTSLSAKKRKTALRRA